jgi:pyruvate/2-oxoglutarate dehydrogenase complex dihydrolipoamide dehydrogenase (E3) component
MKSITDNKFEYDVVVIGAGIAGLVSAVTTNSLGQRVAIVGKCRFGDDCGSFTCLPSKTLIRAGHITRLGNHLEHFGLKNKLKIDLDTTDLMSHVRSVVQKAYEKNMPETFHKFGRHTIIGQIEFVDNQYTVVSGNKIIIATE